MESGVSFFFDNGVLLAGISGEVDHHAARRLREDIDRELLVEKPSVLELDFSNVGFMDSSGIALIIGRYELCRTLGAAMHLVGVSDSLRKIFRISGIERLVGVVIESKAEKKD